MSLKTKFALLLSAIFIGLLLVNFSTLSLVVFPAFEELENRAADKNMERVINILKSDIKDMEVFAYDWATWDDTYNFIKDRNQTYIDTNYTIEYALQANHDLYYIWDLEGRTIINKALNEEGNAYETFKEFPLKGLPNNHPFTKLKEIGSKSSGLIQTARGPMIIAARPITKSSLEGPIRGVLAMGRYLDKGLIDNIKKRSQLDIDVWSLSEKPPQIIPAGTPKNIEPGETKTIISENKKISFVYSSLSDIYGKPLLLMRVSMPRDIVAQGKSTINYGIGMALVSGLVLILVLLFILQRSIIAPLAALAKNIVRLGKRENVAQQLPLNRGDELGVVARSIFSSNEERNQTENILVYQNQILDSIAKKTDLKLTLDKMIELMESILPDAKASILLLDPEGIKLDHLSAPSLPMPYIEAINGFKIGPKVGACGAAAYNNKMIVTEDIANDPNWHDSIKNIALENGLKACWSFPINSSSREVLGTFALYYSEIRPPNENEITLIEPFSRLAGIAIESQKVDQELIESKNIAEKANNAKSEFLSMMSHELRTPMNAILGFGQMLGLNSENNLTSLQKDNVKRIITAGDHLLKLIDEILDLSKIESGNFFLKEENINIFALIDEVILIIQPLAQNRNIQIISPSSVHEETDFYGDSTALKQVLLNLLSNAVKYNKEEGTITVITEATPDEGLRIKISDTGHGISKENIGLLFQPFQRLGAECSPIQGTGMGLSITKHLVELMGGLISVSSSPDEGSCFTVDLPGKKTLESVEEDNANTFISTHKNYASEAYPDDGFLELKNLNLSGLKIPSSTLSQLKEAAKVNNITQIRFYLNELKKDEKDLAKYIEPFLIKYDMNGINHILNQVGHE